MPGTRRSPMVGRHRLNWHSGAGRGTSWTWRTPRPNSSHSNRLQTTSRIESSSVLPCKHTRKLGKQRTFDETLPQDSNRPTDHSTQETGSSIGTLTRTRSSSVSRVVNGSVLASSARKARWLALTRASKSYESMSPSCARMPTRTPTCQFHCKMTCHPDTGSVRCVEELTSWSCSQDRHMPVPRARPWAWP